MQLYAYNYNVSSTKLWNFHSLVLNIQYFEKSVPNSPISPNPEKDSYKANYFPMKRRWYIKVNRFIKLTKYEVLNVQKLENSTIGNTIYNYQIGRFDNTFTSQKSHEEYIWKNYKFE